MVTHVGTNAHFEKIKVGCNRAFKRSPSQVYHISLELHVFLGILTVIVPFKYVYVAFFLWVITNGCSVHFKLKIIQNDIELGSYMLHVFCHMKLIIFTNDYTSKF